MSPKEIDLFFEDTDLRASLALDHAESLVTEAEAMSELANGWFDDVRALLPSNRISQNITEALNQLQAAELTYPETVEALRTRLENL